jgi:hypothetical protein
MKNQLHIYSDIFKLLDILLEPVTKIVLLTAISLLSSTLQ